MFCHKHGFFTGSRKIDIVLVRKGPIKVSRFRMFAIRRFTITLRGDNMVGLETNNNHENLMENLDELSEEQLDEMIREARDINQRLRSLERKQHKHARGESMADQEERTIEEKRIQTKASPLFASASTIKDSSGDSSRCNEGNCVH
ncbi:hypothetical protein OS493_006015 [Desmophyllum pertusum]|uniref:Uncharacterized protein n=1 Tax=Desmophyllum pertusum TaxID=174260 RepID=A0A9W9YFM9_9CNID|nr:hypothetical protein OS493_006015 [Desmophyllum pertusum]